MPFSFLHLPPYPLSCLTFTIGHSRRNALYAPLDFFPRLCLWTNATCGDSGFLPVLYTTLLARWRSSPIQLPDESTDDTLDEFSESQKIQQERLTGRRILLLWLPALCDLTGTTVRTFSHSPLRARDLSCSHLCNWGFTAHEYWFAIYPRVDLSNDAWGTGAVRRDSFRSVLASQAVALPVSSCVSRHHVFHLINVRFRWLSLVTVMAGVSLVGFSGSLIKDTLRPIAPSLVRLLDSIPATGPPVNEPIDEPEATKVVIGICFSV
jgi:hypothetical protein